MQEKEPPREDTEPSTFSLTCEFMNSIFPDIFTDIDFSKTSTLDDEVLLNIAFQGNPKIRTTIEAMRKVKKSYYGSSFFSEDYYLSGAFFAYKSMEEDAKNNVALPIINRITTKLYMMRFFDRDFVSQDQEYIDINITDYILDQAESRIKGERKPLEIEFEKELLNRKKKPYEPENNQEVNMQYPEINLEDFSNRYEELISFLQSSPLQITQTGKEYQHRALKTGITEIFAIFRFQKELSEPYPNTDSVPQAHAPE